MGRILLDREHLLQGSSRSVPRRFVLKFESVRTKPMIDSCLIFTLPDYSKHLPRECI